VLLPFVVVPGVVVVPGTLVAPAGTFVVPPAGVGFVPPAAGIPDVTSPDAFRLLFPELPAFDGPVAETPLLRLIPGLPTALGLFVVLAPLLAVELPAVLVLFVPATVPVGVVALRCDEPVVLVPFTDVPVFVVLLFVVVPVPAPALVEGTVDVPCPLVDVVLLVPFAVVPVFEVVGP